MNVLNKKMLLSIHQLLNKHNSIDTRLAELLTDSFVFDSDCYFLQKLYKNNVHIKMSDFIDKTGYECFINSFHLDDYIEDNFLVQAIFFINRLFEEWKIMDTKIGLEVIVSETDFGLNIKFHAIRENEFWINDNDFDKFDEALLICRDH